MEYWKHGISSMPIFLLRCGRDSPCTYSSSVLREGVLVKVPGLWRVKRVGDALRGNLEAMLRQIFPDLCKGCSSNVGSEH